MRKSGLFVALLVPLLLVAGCGNQSGTPKAASSSPSVSSSPMSPSSKPAALPAWPLCGTVWKGGATLPRKYHGCLQNKNAVKAKGMYCEFGKRLITYDARFYAVPAGTIHRTKALKSDAGYRSAMASCMG